MVLNFIKRLIIHIPEKGFRIKHRLLLAIKSFIENIKLSGKIQSDEKYFSINLKGTKPENMPRYSKKASTSLPL